MAPTAKLSGQEAGEGGKSERGNLVFPVEDVQLAVVAVEAERKRVPPEHPMIVGSYGKVVLEDSGIGEVVRRTDIQAVVGSGTGVPDRNPRKEVAAEKINPGAAGGNRLPRSGIGYLAYETDSLFPGRVRR